MDHGWVEHSIAVQQLDSYCVYFTPNYELFLTAILVNTATFYDSRNAQKTTGVEQMEQATLSAGLDDLQPEPQTQVYYGNTGYGGSNQLDGMRSSQSPSPPSVAISHGLHHVEQARHESKVGYRSAQCLDPVSAFLVPVNESQENASNPGKEGSSALARRPLPIRDIGGPKFVRARNFPRAACDTCHGYGHGCSFISFRNGYVNQIPVAKLWKRYDEQYPAKAESLRRTEEMLTFFEKLKDDDQY